jgi:ABC-type nitrate/sulfonate/bicarbonate transport system substrate-binding protein
MESINSCRYTRTKFRGYRRLVPLALAASLLSLSGGTALAAQKSVPAVPKLSMSTVVLNGGYSGNPGLFWVAQDRGYWKRLGLNASILDTSVSGADSFAVMASGRSQFLFAGSISGLIATSHGADVRGVMSIDIGSPAELVITAAKAKAIGMPLGSSTSAQAKKQLLALKGSHLTIGVTNLASDNYSLLVALCTLNHISIGPNGDINIVTVGSSSALVAAWKAGRIDGYAITPPYTLQSGLATMKMNLIAPVSSFPWVYLLTSSQMIKQHPDTVQAVVTGLVQAFNWATTHRTAAQLITARHYASFGYTQPSIQKYLFNATANDWKTPIMSKNDFAIQKEVAALAGHPVTNVDYSGFLYPKFVDAAVNLLHSHFGNF